MQGGRADSSFHLCLKIAGSHLYAQGKVLYAHLTSIINTKPNIFGLNTAKEGHTRCTVQLMVSHQVKSSRTVSEPLADNCNFCSL